MAHITAPEANAWLESTKLSLSTIDNALDGHVASIILGQLSTIFDTQEWIDESSTPKLVRTIISMYYAAAIYDRSYSDDIEGSTSNYAKILRRLADQNIDGLINGSIALEEQPIESTTSPVFFPNDLSSANEPTSTNPSDGGPAFLMGSVF